MKKFGYLMLVFMGLMLCLEGYEIVVRSVEGELIVADIAPQTSFGEVMENLQSFVGTHNEFVLDLATNVPTLHAVKEGRSRNYLVSITSDERSDIRYIVNTLGMASMAKVARSKSSLKKAGDRVDHVHPLRFLICVFTDDEMKASIHAMQSRSWIWDEFYSGLKSSLEEESDRNNMEPEFVTDFSAHIGISVDLISSSIAQKKWKQFVSTLIDQIPRNENTDRYNM